MYLQLIRTVERLSQSVAILEIVFHLIRINLRIGQLSQSTHLPHQDAKGPNITALAVLGLLQCLQGEPLDGSVLSIAQGVVVAGEEIAAQGAVCEFNTQLVIDTEKGRRIYAIRFNPSSKYITLIAKKSLK